MTTWKKFKRRKSKGSELNKTRVLIGGILKDGEGKNGEKEEVLERHFNEDSCQKAPSKKHGLFISRPSALLTSSQRDQRPPDTEQPQTLQQNHSQLPGQSCALSLR